MGKFLYKEILTRDFLSSDDIKNISHAELGRRLNIHPSVIIDYRAKYGLSTDLSDRCRLSDIKRQIIIPDWQMGFLAGKLFGDGSLVKNSQGNCRFRVRHCDKQREYVDVCYDVLRNLCVGDITTNELNGKLYHGFSTIWHPQITYLWDLFYKTGRKAVTQHNLNLLTIFGLVAWYYDDGSYNKGNYVLSTCSFTLDELKLIRQHLYKKFGIKTTPMRKSNGKEHYWYLYFASNTRYVLEKYLSRFYLSCFDYKIGKYVLRPSETTRKALWKIPEVKI